MSFSTDNSAIKVTPGSELERAISRAKSTSEITTLLHEAAQAQKLIEPDAFDPDGHNYFGFHPVEPGTVAANAPHVRVLRVNGVAYTIQSDTAEGLDAAELAKMKEIIGTVTPAATTEQQRDSQGRFVAQPTKEEADATAAEQARLAQLEASFRLGQISAADYIKQSGAVDSYLSENGVSVEALQKVSDVVYTDRWAAAAAEFIADHPDWQGGAGNQKVISDIVVEQKWENEDPRAAIEKAYQIALQEGRLVENPELTQRDEIGKAQTFDEIKQAVGYHGPDGSSFWGR